MPVQTFPASGFAKDLAFTKAWLAPLGLGVNVERGWAWSIPGGYTANAAYLKSIGITHVRLFYPFRPGLAMDGPGTDMPPSKTQFARILDAAAAYMASGLKVFLACCDVITPWEDWNTAEREARIDTHLTNAAAWIAERSFDKQKFAVGAWNEAGGQHAGWPERMQRWHAIVRAAMPGYVMFAGSQEWNSYAVFVASTPFVADGLVVWPLHSYEQLGASTWQARATALKAWSAANSGMQVVVGEYGRPVGEYDGFLPSMAQFKPMLWAQTYGSTAPLNISGSDPKLTPAYEDKIVSFGATLALAADATPALPVPQPPNLSGPYGPQGDSTDETLLINLRKATDWAAAAAAALLDYSNQISAYLQAADAAEQEARKAGDKALDAKIGEEVADRVEAVAAETTARTNADTTLQNNITAEQNARTSAISSLTTTVNGKANATHSHAIGDVSGLQSALDAKAGGSHTHTVAQVTSLQQTLDTKCTNSRADGMQSQIDSLAARVTQAGW